MSGNARLALYNKTNRVKEVEVTKALAAAGDYAAGDVMSEAATAGTSWNFADVVGINGASGTIVKATALMETTGLTPALTMYLFHTEPTCAVNDNVANTAVLHADASNYVGSIDFPAMEDLGTGDSHTIVSEADGGNLKLPFKCASADVDLYGVVVTRDAITGETATDDLIIKLTIDRD